MNTKTLGQVTFGVFFISNLVMSSVSYASCRTQGNPTFNIPKGFGMDVYRISDGGNCSIGYTSFGGVSFTSAQISKAPSSGALIQNSSFNFLYKPKKGFSGEDKFTINLCGNYEGKNAGCVNNNYTIKVEAK